MQTMTALSTPSSGANKLALYLNDRGDLLRQILREKNIAVYARSSGRASAPHQYELIVVQHKAGLGEVFPTRGEWNRFGWSFPVYEHEFVCQLAQEMATFPGPYRAWIRRQMIASRPE
jgi:hypothetical protein